MDDNDELKNMTELLSKISYSMSDYMGQLKGDCLSTPIAMPSKIDIEMNKIEYQAELTAQYIVDGLKPFLDAHEEDKQKVFIAGETQNASVAIISLIVQAKKEIILIDNFISNDTFTFFAKRNRDVKVTIYTDPKTHITEKDVDFFNKLAPPFDVKHNVSFHDRFLIIDNSKLYLIGASIKDAGKKCFAICEMHPSFINIILEQLKE